MSPHAGSIPRWQALTLQVVATGIDVFVVTAGVLTITGLTPPSLVEAGANGGLSMVWSLMIVVGGIVANVATWANRVEAQTFGCFVAGGGGMVWAIAAAVQPEATSLSYSVAAWFGATSLLLAYRGMAVAVGARLVEGWERHQ